MLSGTTWWKLQTTKNNNVMKKLLLIIVSVALAANLKAQSLDDFYQKAFEIYTPFSGITAKSASMEALGMESGMNFWGIAGIGGNVCNTKPWGISFGVGTRQIGDLFYILRALFSKDGKNNGFRDQYYLSDLGFLPNMRLGLNVYAKENMVINVGLYNSYYITYVGFVSNGSSFYENVHLLSAGPNINIDRAINDWLAARVSTGPMFAYAKKNNNNCNPSLWESNIELFTKWGFFAGFNILSMHGFHDNIEDNMKVKRYDLRLGIRVEM
jgi:hypothetical protein